jgi:hypothetical protein
MVVGVNPDRKPRLPRLPKNSGVPLGDVGGRQNRTVQQRFPRIHSGNTRSPHLFQKTRLKKPSDGFSGIIRSKAEEKRGRNSVPA